MLALTTATVLKHVRQHTTCDCVIATAAIVAHLPYQMAADLSPVTPGQRGLFPPEIRKLLKRTTHIDWRGPGLTWFRNVESFANFDGTIVLSIQEHRNLWSYMSKWATCHCIAVIDGVVYDPVFDNATTCSEYARRHWKVAGFYRPSDLRKLLKFQNDNLMAHRRTRIWDAIFNN